MADESHSFSTARARLEEIVSQVRKKDTSLEKSLDLLEEGVRLANACTELIDHQDWATTSAAEGVGTAAPEPSEADAATDTEPGAAEAASADVAAERAPEPGPLAAVATAIDDAEPAVEFFDADDAWDDESEVPAGGETEDPSAPEG